MRHLPRFTLSLLLPALLTACGDGNSSSAGATESTGPGGTDTGTTAGGTTPTTGSSAPTSTDVSGTVSATGTGSTTDPTTGGPVTATSSTGEPATGTTAASDTADTSDTTGAVSASSSSSTGGPPEPVCGNALLEPGEECDDGDDNDKNFCSNACKLVPCDQQEGGGGGDFDFSYIWIANSPQGTVSKVDTVMLKEVARYRTDAAGNASPSRTAVNVDGRFAAVANRTAGSITVFAAAEDDCIDNNNNGVIDTSTGPNDIKAWGEDECMLWNVKINPSNNNNEQRGPRPLGWDFADQDPVTCKFQTNTLWTGWYGNGGEGIFWHLDEKGAKLGEVIVPVWGNKNSWGPYGGAVDKNHDFWVAGWHGPLVRINHADYTYKMWNDPMLSQVSSYGMTLDKEGDPWFGGCSGSIVTFNAQNETFKNIGSPGGCLRGLMVDGEGRGWIARNGGACLIQIDTVNDSIVNANINLPGCQTVVGVSIDIEGFVWVVDQGGRAFKVDPDTLQSQTVTGFSGPYTYSDMTGAGIRLQALPQ